MPFVEKYAVDFSGGNLNPSLNTLGWPAMTHNPMPNDTSDSQGIILNVTRSGGAAVANDVYVPFAAGTLALNQRFLMRLEFDLPWAEQLPANPAFPEPWAVGLAVSITNTLDPVNAAAVTCQFHRTNGVRVNTPGSMQGDQSFALDPAPIDYTKYIQGAPNMSNPHAREYFTLEHSFCGIFDSTANPQVTPHSTGCGWLTIGRHHYPHPHPDPQDRSDHRVYSSKAVGAAAPNAATPPSILAIGASLVTLSGVGNLRARFRRFSVSFH